jgi:outer membrane protein assembly factor BamB
LDFEGKIIWTNRSYKFYSQHGYGASPLLYQDLLVVPFDGSNDGEDKRIGWKQPWDKSFVLALDVKTGKERWKTSRGQSRIAHVTPNIYRGPDGDEIISGAGDVVQSFAPDSGKLLWTVFSHGEGVVPSIVVGKKYIFSASGFEKPTIRAVRPGGKGDVTSTHIAWEQIKGVPTVPSFVYLEPHLFTITEGGVAMCLKEENGEIVWQERVGGNHASSPVVADGKIYFLADNGECTVIEASTQFKVLARSSIEERCQASPAISNGQIFIRSEKHLWAIGKTAP